MHVQDVPQDREQVFAHAPDHVAVDEGPARRVAQIQAQAAILLHEVDLEIAVTFEQHAGIVDFQTAAQHGQRATAEHFVEFGRAALAQQIDFALGQHGQRVQGCHPGMGHDAVPGAVGGRESFGFGHGECYGQELKLFLNILYDRPQDQRIK